MTTRRTRGASGALAMLMLLALLAAAPAARAEGSDPVSDATSDPAEGWKKVLAYARCAFDVFRAVTPADWGLAVFDCTHLYFSESPLTAGGAQ